MVIDPISNFITALQNAATAGKQTVRVPFSNLKHAVAEVLIKEGYLTSAEKRGKKVRKHLEVLLSYENGQPKIHGVKRLSKPSQRRYAAVADIVPVKQGFGKVIVSTPKGIMTGDEAKKTNVGGELLFQIW